MSKSRERTALILLVMIMALGVFLRLHLLDKQSLWDDEISTIDFTAQSPSEMWREVGIRDANPALFYMVFHYWRQVGNKVAEYRLFPAIFGVLSLFLFFILARKFLSGSAALTAALLMAINPLAIYCSQEVRSHTLILFLSVLSVMFFVRCLEKQTWGSLAGLAIVNGLLLNTQYFSFFLVAFQIVYAASFGVAHLVRARKDIPALSRLASIAVEAPGTQSGWVSLVSLAAWTDAQKRMLRGLAFFAAAQILAAMAFAPWIKSFLSQMVRGQSWRPYMAPWAVLGNLFIYFTVGHATTRLPALLPTLEGMQDIAPVKFVLWTLLILLPFLVVLVLGFRRDGKREDGAWPRILVSMYLLVPVLLITVITQKIHLFDVRHMILFLPPFILLIAQGLESVRKRSRLAFFALFLYLAGASLISLNLYYNDPAYAKQDWKGAFQYIKSHSKKGDVILTYHHLKALGLEYYSDGSIPIHYAFSDKAEGETIEQAKALLHDRIEGIKSGAGRIWLFDYHGMVFDPLDEVRKALKENLYLMEMRQYMKSVYRFTIELYTPDFQEARAGYKPFVDFKTNAHSPGQLVSGWFHEAPNSRWMSEEGTVVLSARGGYKAVEAEFYAYYPFLGQKPFQVRLLADGKELGAVTVNGEGLFKVRGPLPPDLQNQDLLRVSLRSDAWFRPKDFLDVEDVTHKSVLVISIRLIAQP